MKIIVENIGVFKYAEYELANLTIICGKNNTGKTYATYCLYGFLDYFIRGYNVVFPPEQVQKLLNDGTLSISLDFTQKDLDKYLQEACKRYLKYLPRIFAAQDKYFKDTRIQVKLDVSEIEIPKEFEHSYRSDKKDFLQIVKPCDKNELLVSLLINDEEYLDNASFKSTVSRIIGDALKEILFSKVFKDCFIASAERTGSVIFKDELNVQKNTLLREVAHSEEIDIEDIVNKIYNTSYALPVRRSIDFIRNLDSISKEDGELYKKHPEIIEEFQKIAGGIYKASKEGLYYYPNMSKTTKLSIGESASSVRSLLVIYFYLRYVAKPGQIFMIDEPELNLHPECQRRFARLLAKLVNYGIQVFITTHSDYMVKEFNTLLMLNSRLDNDRVKKLMEKYEYHKNELLSASQIRMYISKKECVLLPGNQRKTNTQTLVPVKVNPLYGMEVVSFDDTINDMNSIQETIMFSDYGQGDA